MNLMFQHILSNIKDMGVLSMDHFEWLLVGIHRVCALNPSLAMVSIFS